MISDKNTAPYDRQLSPGYGSPLSAEGVSIILIVTSGAAVLAHSLRNNGTKGKLVALFTPETLKEPTINELKV